jgi:hypothetical protein
MNSAGSASGRRSRAQANESIGYLLGGREADSSSPDCKFRQPPKGSAAR